MLGNSCAVDRFEMVCGRQYNLKLNVQILSLTTTRKWICFITFILPPISYAVITVLKSPLFKNYLARKSIVLKVVFVFVPDIHAQTTRLRLNDLFFSSPLISYLSHMLSVSTCLSLFSPPVGLFLSLFFFSLFFAVPTFASFLKEVDSPYEVHDYVRAYLGDTSQAKDFAKQFLERRAKQNGNQQKSLQSQQPKNQQVCAAVSRFKEFGVRM